MVVVIDTGLVTGIKKGQTLKELVEGHDAQKVDEVRKAVVEGENNLGKLLEMFGSWLNTYSKYNDVKLENVLTPEELKNFLQLTSLYEEHPSYYYTMQFFMVPLINNCYNAGYNNLIFNSYNLSAINGLCLTAEGAENNLLKILIDGKIGDCLGQASKYVEYTVNGNAGENCVLFSEHSNCLIRGNCGGYAFNKTKKSTLVVLGDVGIKLGFCSQDNTFVVHGDVGKDCGFLAHNCEFKTPNRETLKKFIEQVPKKLPIDRIRMYRLGCNGNESSNKIYFIHPDGREELVKA